MTLDSRSRWLALLIVCLGDLMIVLDVTIVGVALPSIREDLGFSETSLAWVVNAYLLTFGGFLLLGGRLGDLFGHRRLFLAGIGLFTLASLACGLAGSQAALIVARAVQGVGAAVVSAVALSLIVTLFTEPGERAKAMGVFGFVAAGGGSLGVLLGGVLTDALSWNWIFLVNVPIGIAVVVFSLLVLPGGRGVASGVRLDIAGALLVTVSMMVAVYAIVNGNEVGWTTTRTLGLLAVAGALMGAFLVIESRVAAPLVPLGLFKLRNLAVSNVIGILWSAAMFAWFFLSALYLQLVLGYSPMEVGLAFLPGNLIMAVFSLGLSARIVMRYGIRAPLGVGLGHHRGVGHGLVLDQAVLDLARADAVAGGLEHVVAAALIPEITVGIHHRGIAGAAPRVVGIAGELVAGGRRVVPVAEEEHWIGIAVDVAAVHGHVGLDVAPGLVGAGQHPLLVLGELVAGRRAATDQPGNDGERHVGADEVLGVGVAELGGDERAPVAALSAEAVVAEHVAHEVHPQLGDAGDVHPQRGERDREPVAGQRRDDDVEAVGRVAAVRGRVREGTDDLLELDDRAGPAVGEDQRRGVGLG